MLNICVERQSGTVPLGQDLDGHRGRMSRSEAAEEPDVWGVGNQGPFLRTSSRMWKLSPSQRPGPATTYHRAGKSRRWRAALLSGSRAHATPRRLPGLLSCAAWSVLWPMSSSLQVVEALRGGSGDTFCRGQGGGFWGLWHVNRRESCNPSCVD